MELWENQCLGKTSSRFFITEQLTSKSLHTWSSSCCPRISNLSLVPFNFPACIGLRKVSPAWSFKIEIIIIRRNMLNTRDEALTHLKTPGDFVPRAFPLETSSRLPISNGKVLETRLNRRTRVEKKMATKWFWQPLLKHCLEYGNSYVALTFNSNRLLISPFERCSSTDINISLDKIAMRANICRVSPKFSSSGNGAWERMACASWLRSKNGQKVTCWKPNIFKKDLENMLFVVTCNALNPNKQF